jgi:hypothetical protein
VIDVDRREQPFPHCTADRVFPAELARELSEVLDDRSDWSYLEEAHYRTHTRHWWADELPPAISPLLTDDVLGELVSSMETAFDESFAGRFTVTANKQSRGHGSRVHNDHFPDPDHPYFFTHRLIVYLTPDDRAAGGGQLGLFGSADPGDLRRLITPVFNSGVAMAMGPRSFHAVSTITAGTRYSLCLSFTNADRRYHP